MAWIEFHPTELKRKKKFCDLRLDLGWSVNSTLGFLGNLWTTTMELAESGEITDWTDAYLREVCDASDTQVEIMELLLRHNFLEKTPENRVLVHDWLDYAGRYLTNKYASSNVQKLKQIWLLHGQVYGKPNASRTQVQRNRKATLPNLPNQPNQPYPTKPKRNRSALAPDTIDLRSIFARFYDAYPKHKARAKAYEVWRRICPDNGLVETILAKLEEAKKSNDWLKDGGKYIPYPASWLNGKRWEDEMVTETLDRNPYPPLPPRNP